MSMCLSYSAELLSHFFYSAFLVKRKPFNKAISFRNSFVCLAWDSPVFSINVIGRLLGMPFRVYHKVPPLIWDVLPRIVVSEYL